MTPDHPKLPNSPVLGGMNGCQFAVFTYMKPKPITSSTIAILMNDDDVVEARRLLDADDEQHRHQRR